MCTIQREWWSLWALGLVSVCVCVCDASSYIRCCIHECRESCNIFPECNTVSMCLLCALCKSQMINIPQNGYIVTWITCISIYMLWHACLFTGSRKPLTSKKANRWTTLAKENRTSIIGKVGIKRIEWMRERAWLSEWKSVSEMDVKWVQLGPAHSTHSHTQWLHTCTTSASTKTSHK